MLKNTDFHLNRTFYIVICISFLLCNLLQVSFAQPHTTTCVTPRGNEVLIWAPLDFSWGDMTGAIDLIEEYQDYHLIERQQLQVPVNGPEYTLMNFVWDITN